MIEAMRLAAVVLALAGCSRVLGLDDIAVDQNALSVTGSLTTRRVLNSATRLPFVADDMPVGHAPASSFVQLDDQTAVNLTWHADDTFFFDREHAMQGYRLVFPGTFDQPTVEYQLSDAELALLDRAWGRPESQRATNTGGATVSYTFTTPPVPNAAGTLVLASTGLWTETVIATLPGNESFTFAWTDAQTDQAAQPVGLLDTTYNDRLYYVLYTIAANATTYQLTHYRFDDQSLSNTTPVNVMNQPVYAVQPDSCVLVRAPRAQESARIATAGYGTVAQAISSWRLLAVPVLAMGTDVAFPLAFDTSTTDVAGTPINFGTPFAGYDLSLEMATVVLHPIVAPGATTPFTLVYGSDLYILPQASAATSMNTECMMQPAIAFTTVQLPTAPLLDGFPLTRGQPMAAPIQLQLDRSRLAKLTWTITQQGALPELYRADLFEVYVDTSGNTQLRPHATWYTTNVTPDGAPQVVLDPALLDNGKTYVIEIENVIGQPKPQDSAVALHPYSIGFMYSDLLQVTN